MSNPAPVVATFDPSTPLGSESLRIGPSRIRAIPTGILDLLGLPDGAVGSPLSPIKDIINPNTPLNPGGTQLTVWNDPESALSVVTKQYADRRALFVPINAGSPVNAYTATVATPFSFDQNALYIVQNAGPTNTAAVTLQINALPPVSVRRMDGSVLAANDFVTGTLYVMGYDGTALRILSFVGGTLTQPLLLSEDPQVGTEAATKAYVDRTVVAPVEALQTTDNIDMLADTVHDLVTLAVTIPNDAAYVVHVETLAWFNPFAPSLGTQVFTWVTESITNKIWATGAGIMGDTFSRWGINGAGISLPFPAGSTPTLTLRATTQSRVLSNISPNAAGALAGLPESHLRATVMRAT